jgi:hypothetical protein
MKNIVRIMATWFMLATGLGCSEKIEHDTGLASKRAVEFAEATFVRRNLDQGYALLADKARSYVPLDKFTEKVTQMHPSGHPNKVTVVSAVPVAGEKLVIVSLRSAGDGGQFEYAVSMAGTAATDYRVTLFNGGRSS